MNMLAPRISVRYQPLAQIGRGGMAEVILAQTQFGPDDGRLVVLKRLWPELGDDPDFVAMFLREARLCVRMVHPNVVRAHEIVEDAEGTAIAMEYLDGQPLARVLTRLLGSRSVGLDAWLHVLLDVLEALDYAHALREPDGRPAGIVHRDVNPQNVFVTYDGTVKLLDFGVAKSARDVIHTRPGDLRGKLAYLAPEQALGEMVDRRADVFSVGVMLWEILTGRRMWQSTTESGVLRRLAAGVIPPLPPDAVESPELREVCARALARTPEGRFATAAAFAAALRPLVGGTGEGTRALGPAVSLAFAPERAARQTLIEEHLRRVRLTWGGGAPPAGGSATEANAALACDDDAVELSLEDVLEDVPAEQPIEALTSPSLDGGAPAGDAEAEGQGAESVRERKVTARAGTITTVATLASAGAAAPSPSATLTWAALLRSHPWAGPVRRTGWMVMGFALAAVGGAAYAARSGARVPAATVAAAPAFPAVPVQPIVVNPPAAGEAGNARACALAAPAAWGPADVASPASDNPRYRRRTRTNSVERVRRAEATAEIARASGRTAPPPARLDDETLEPTIDLSDVPTVTRATAVMAPPDSAPRSAPITPVPLASTRRSTVRPIDVADPFAP